MKKIFTILSFFLIFNAYSQQEIYSSDFESYSSGSKIAKVAGNPWTTWSAAPGGAEDGTISSAKAHSGTKSILIANNNDLVLKLGSKTTGRYAIEWYMLVDSSKVGYFNMLNLFSGNNSVWNFEAYILKDTFRLGAADANIYTLPFKSNVWHQFKIIVDLDDNFSSMYVDSIELVNFKWGSGVFGNVSNLKLDGIDFYGWNTGGTCNYYFDDLKYTQLNPTTNSITLNAQKTGNDISLKWEKPDDQKRVYLLTRNGSILSKTTENQYLDIFPWPSEYKYSLRTKLEKELGYSKASDAASVTVTGGVSRNFVLMEEFTGTWCVYCPGAAMGLRDLIDVNNKEAVAIAYHSGDDYANADGNNRALYYDVGGFPTMVADGGRTGYYLSSGNASQTMYQTYLPWYEDRIQTQGFQNMDMSISSIGDNNYRATITVDETFHFFPKMKLHTALVESNIAKTWFNQTELDFVCRKMYPDFNGTDIQFTGTSPQTFTFDFSLGTYVKGNCEFVAFLQDNESKEVTQTIKIDLSSISGVNELNGNDISVFPNPANQYVKLMSDGNGVFNIFTTDGKLVKSGSVDKSDKYLDINDIPTGLYIIKYENKTGVFNKKLMIQH